jgi:hypothetical protein
MADRLMGRGRELCMHVDDETVAKGMSTCIALELKCPSK